MADIYINFFKEHFNAYGTGGIDTSRIMSSSTGRNSISEGAAQAASLQEQLNQMYYNRALQLLKTSGKTIEQDFLDQLLQYTFGFLQISMSRMNGLKSGQNSYGFRVSETSTSASRALKAIFKNSTRVDEFRTNLKTEISNMQNPKIKKTTISKSLNAANKDLFLKLDQAFDKAEQKGQDALQELWKNFIQAMDWIKSVTTGQGEFSERVIQAMVSNSLNNIMSVMSAGQTKAKPLIRSGSSALGVLMNSQMVYHKVMSDSLVRFDKNKTFTLSLGEFRGDITFSGAQGQQKADVIATGSWLVNDKQRKYNLSVKNYVRKAEYEFKSANIIYALNMLAMEQLNLIGNAFSYSMRKGSKTYIEGADFIKNDIAESLILLSLYEGMSGSLQQGSLRDASAQFFVVNGPMQTVTYKGQRVECPSFLVYFIPEILQKTGIVLDNKTKIKQGDSSINKFPAVAQQKANILNIDVEREFLINPQYQDCFDDLSMAAGQKSSAITMAQILAQFATIHNLAFSIPVSVLAQ